MTILKLTLVVVMCLMITFMAKAFRSSLKTKTTTDKAGRETIIATRTKLFQTAFWITLAFVGMVLVKTQLISHPLKDALYYIHRAFAESFFLTLAASAFLFNGKRRPYIRTLDMICSLIFVPAAILGSILIYRM